MALKDEEPRCFVVQVIPGDNITAEGNVCKPQENEDMDNQITLHSLPSPRAHVSLAVALGGVVCQGK